MSRRRSLLVFGTLVLCLSAGWMPPPGGAAAAEEGLISRTFTIQYRDVADVLALIQPAFGDRGSYAVQPRSKSVTVTDTPERIRRIADLITAYDQPPRGIELVVQLMRAEEGPADSASPRRRSRRVGLPPAVIRDLTKWGIVEPIGSVSLTTTENESGSVVMGDDYRLRFTVGSISMNIGVIRMERFVLERARRGPAGAGAEASYTPLMDLVLNLRDHQTTVLGATSSQDSDRALFLSVTATIVEP